MMSAAYTNQPKPLWARGPRLIARFAVANSRSDAISKAYTVA